MASICRLIRDSLDPLPGASAPRTFPNAIAGRKVTGWPILTLSRGEVVWDGADVTGEPGRGRFLRCDKPAAANPYGGVLDNT